MEIRYNETNDYWEITDDGTTYKRIATTGGGGAAMNDVVDDTTPQLGGTLDTNGHDVYWDTNKSAWFGANTYTHGNIYHSGTTWWLLNNTGNMTIRNAEDDKSIFIQSDNSIGGTATYFEANGSTGESIMYWYGTERLKASNNGIIVTGTLNTHTIPGGTGTLALTSQVASDTDGLPEGSTNKYYTDAQVATYLAGGSVANVIIGGVSEYAILAFLIAIFACSRDSAIIAKIACPL